MLAIDRSGEGGSIVVAAERRLHLGKKIRWHQSTVAVNLAVEESVVIHLTKYRNDVALAEWQLLLQKYFTRFIIIIACKLPQS